MEVKIMPNFDGTGPRGQGSLTGKGLGPCGCGQRRMYGRGFRRFSMPFEPSKEEQKKILSEHLKELELEKQEAEKRLKELE